MSHAFFVSLLALATVSIVPTSCGAEPALGAKCLDLLRQAKEPASIRNTTGIEHFRLIFDQTFSVPLIVRVTKAGNRVILRSLLFTGVETGRVTDVKTRTLSLKDWDNLTTLANAANFWTLPYRDNEAGCDGSSWVIEAACGDGTYHVVSRWTASLDTKERQLVGFVALGRHLSRLSPHKLELH